jgi:hypothetical protein
MSIVLFFFFVTLKVFNLAYTIPIDWMKLLDQTFLVSIVLCNLVSIRLWKLLLS